MLDLDWLISVDDHVIEPANVWQGHRQVKELAPPTSPMTTWTTGSSTAGQARLRLVGRAGQEEFSPLPMSSSDMRDGCYNSQAPASRTWIRAGVLADIMLPLVPRFCGPGRSPRSTTPTLTWWLRVTERLDSKGMSVGSTPGHYIPLVIIAAPPTPRPPRSRSRGTTQWAHRRTFARRAQREPLPASHRAQDKDGYWDPVMQAANDNEMVVCMHVGSSSTLPRIAHDTPTLAEPGVGRRAHRGHDVRLVVLRLLRPHARAWGRIMEGSMGWNAYFLRHAAGRRQQHTGHA